MAALTDGVQVWCLCWKGEDRRRDQLGNTQNSVCCHVLSALHNVPVDWIVAAESVRLSYSLESVTFSLPGEVLAKKFINVKVCACPGRDKLKEEQPPSTSVSRVWEHPSVTTRYPAQIVSVASASCCLCTW